uniref:Uncharacterized protein n=1 Tax=Oryzias latipes TaxID=8090 RepID=A0A3P9JEG2_ORYLA
MASATVGQASKAGVSPLVIQLIGKYIGIVLEGIQVLHNLENVSHPQNLRDTFEVLPKIIMELNEGELSNKVRALKNRLFQVLCPHLPVVLEFNR